LEQEGLPKFGKITPEAVVPAIRRLSEVGRERGREVGWMGGREGGRERRKRKGPGRRRRGREKVLGWEGGKKEGKEGGREDF
jgi:hypothetical protein